MKSSQVYGLQLSIVHISCIIPVSIPDILGMPIDIAQILAYLVHNMSKSQLYLGFGHFGWLLSFFGQ